MRGGVTPHFFVRFAFKGRSVTIELASSMDKMSMDKIKPGSGLIRLSHCLFIMLAVESITI